MTSAKLLLCNRCKARIPLGAPSERFLLPLPDGEIRWRVMHLRCAVTFFALATTREYADSFDRKMRKAAA